MRNVFDQYDQWENKLTHALMTTLHEDRVLLGAFILWAIDEVSKVSPNSLKVVEQSLPGEVEVQDPDAAERRGLPDGCIFNEDDWGLLVESKITAPLILDQLQRHINTAKRKGLREVRLLVLTTDHVSCSLPRNAFARSWTELYQWLKTSAYESDWARRLAQFMEVLEARLIDEQVFQKGTITMFTGIPFGQDNPYSYREAKRVLGLAMDDLRPSEKLAKQFDIDKSSSGRSSITGKDGIRVWDFLKLNRAAESANFTEFPHLTFAIHQTYSNAIITVPNGIRSEFRRKLVQGGLQSFREIFRSILTRFDQHLGHIQGLIPYVEVLQRHYRTQRSEPTIDGHLEFDLRTAFDVRSLNCPVKNQPEWLNVAYEVLSNKSSNIQLGVGGKLYYDFPISNTAEVLDVVTDVWIACKPLVDRLLH